MEEIWKDIKGYSGYQVSNLGRVRTHNKITYTEKHGERHWKNRILKFKPDYNSRYKEKQGTGYRVTLWKNGKGKDYLVARLVATTFLENLIDTKIDEYVLIEGEHCSCYGFDGTDWWCIKLTEEELDELLGNADKSEGLRKELKEFWSRYCGK